MAYCPSHHALVQFNAPNKTFRCDGCYGEAELYETLYGCRKCNYDLCDGCYYSQKLKNMKKSSSDGYNCPGDHKLQYFITSHSGFYCNKCYQKRSKSSVMYGCRSCDWDLCFTCYMKKVEVEYHSNKSKDNYHCPGYHTLNKFNTNHAGYHCDHCAKPAPKYGILYGCRICDYDLCSSCYSQKYETKTLYSPHNKDNGSIKCNKGHNVKYTMPFELVQTDYGYIDGYTCNSCYVSYSKHGSYHCQYCQYDLCNNCYKKALAQISSNKFKSNTFNPNKYGMYSNYLKDNLFYNNNDDQKQDDVINVFDTSHEERSSSSRFVTSSNDNPFEWTHPKSILSKSNYLKQYKQFNKYNVTNESVRDCLSDYKTKQHFDKLPSSWKIEQKCVRLWTLESSVYETITQSLYSDNYHELRAYMPIIRGLNLFICHPTRREMIGYRGSQMSNKQFMFYKTGRIYRAPAVGATSISPKIAKKFQKNKNVLITFRINKNCWNAAEIKEFSKYQNEEEVLLPPYTAFKVLKKTYNSLEVQVLDNKATSHDVDSIFI